MPDEPLYLGLDIGTSGARAVAIDGAGLVAATGRAALADAGADHRDPAVWWAAAKAALTAVFGAIDPARVVALAVDGTSGTLLPVDAGGAPLAKGVMYNDPRTDRDVLAAIAAHAPPASAAHGSSSGLARALVLQAETRPAAVLHQADWIAAQFTGVLATDENNALKTGYDPVAGTWPDWIAATGLEMALLPPAHPPGSAVAPVTPAAAAGFGLRRETLVVAGTTDGCASFLATGAAAPGDAVTALGSTLTLKILSDRPVFAAAYGIYSHRLLGRWLAGGASNTGGSVLLAHFDADRIAELSARIDPDAPCGLDYYPLVRPGERFPIADPELPPRLVPRPADDAGFLHGLLDGMARIERLGYDRLAEQGAPRPARVRTVGGGARNGAWTRLRQHRLGVPFADVVSEEAAYGTALLARHGAQVARVPA